MFVFWYSWCFIVIFYPFLLLFVASTLTFTFQIYYYCCDPCFHLNLHFKKFVNFYNFSLTFSLTLLTIVVNFSLPSSENFFHLLNVLLNNLSMLFSKKHKTHISNIPQNIFRGLYLFVDGFNFLKDSVVGPTLKLCQLVIFPCATPTLLTFFFCFLFLIA